MCFWLYVFFFKQKTAYEMRISDWSSDVCSSDLKAAFKKPGGKTLEDWIDNCPNADYAALTYQGGAAWRARLMADVGGKPNVKKLLDGFDDEEIGRASCRESVCQYV